MSARPLSTEIYIAASDGDVPRAAELVNAIGHRARCVQRGAFDAGADVPGETTRAIEGAGLFVILLSGASALDPGLLAEVTATLAQVRRDPSRKLVPVYLDDDAKGDRGEKVGLSRHQGIPWSSGGEVADKIVSRVALLRAQWERRAVLAVVAVDAELGAASKAVAEHLGKMTAVERVIRIDAAGEGAAAGAEAADFVLVLLGGRTGGTDAIAKLLDAGRVGLKAKSTDPDIVPDDESRPAKVARARITDVFESAEDAARRAQAHFDEWLRQWAPREPGKGALLEPWERTYLEVRLAKWEHGSYGVFAARAAGRQLDRARLYVPLRAARGQVRFDAEGRLVVDTPRVGPGGEHEAEEVPNEESAPYLERIVSHTQLPYLVLEGEAGAGKTVLLQHVAYALASQHLAKPMPDVELDSSAVSKPARRSCASRS